MRGRAGHCDGALGCYGLLTAGGRGVSCLPAVVDFGEQKTQRLEHCHAATEGQTALSGALSPGEFPKFHSSVTEPAKKRMCVCATHAEAPSGGGVWLREGWGRGDSPA